MSAFAVEELISCTRTAPCSSITAHYTVIHTLFFTFILVDTFTFSFCLVSASFHQFSRANRIKFLAISVQGPVSRKSRIPTFRVTKISLYLQKEHVSCFETLQLFCLFFCLKHIKRAGFHGKRIIVLRITFRARCVTGSFEKLPPRPSTIFCHSSLKLHLLTF